MKTAAWSAPLLDSVELDARLDDWARWARSPAPGSSNGSAGYLKERLDQAADSAEMTDEIAITERAVAKTKAESRMHWRVISRYYLGRLSEVEIGLDLQRSHDQVKVDLLRARGSIASYIILLDNNFYMVKNIAV